MQILAARLAEDLAVLVDLHPAQEGRLDARRELESLERRVALRRWRLARADGPGAGRIDEGDVGVEPGRDVALAVQTEAPRCVPARDACHVVVVHAALRALAHQRRQQVLGAAEPALGHPHVAEVALRDLHLVAAARVVADDPVELAGQQRLPEELDVGARADRRIDLGQLRGGRVDVEHQVADRHLALEVDVREHLGHRQRRLHGLARAEVQQVDVGQRGLVREVSRREHGESLGVRRPRRAVGREPLHRLVLLDDLRVGGHDLCGLAVQAERQLARLARHRFAGGLQPAHDEFEVGDVVALVLADHQEVALGVAGAVQPVRAVEHEDLEAGDAVLLDQHRHLLDVRPVHRREVIAVVDVEAVLRDLQHLGEEFLVRAALVEVVLAGAEVVEARGHAAHRRRLALAHRVLVERRVDAAVHVRVDDAGKREAPLAVVDRLRALGGEPRSDLSDLAADDRDVGSVNGVAVRAHHAHVLDQEVELGRLAHRGDSSARRSLS